MALRASSVLGKTVAIAEPAAATNGVGTERYRFLGICVDGFTRASFLDAVADWVVERRLVLVGHHNAHSLALLQHEQWLGDFYARAHAVFVDGMAVVLLGRVLGVPVPASSRIAVLDWIWPLLARAEHEGWTVVHVGGASDVLDVAVAKIATKHPRLRFTAVHGFFDMHDALQNAAVLQQLRRAEPSVLLVGMGMPRQETWLLDNLDRLPGCVVVTVGGILSFLGDERPTPPRFLGPLGLEWLFRLVTEPRRLWRRYLVEPLALVPLVVAEHRRGRRSR